jgi:hypothetical protein
LLPGGGLDTLPRFLADRRHYYDCLLASDAEIIAQIQQCGRRADNAA